MHHLQHLQFPKGVCCKCLWTLTLPGSVANAVRLETDARRSRHGWRNARDEQKGCTEGYSTE